MFSTRRKGTVLPGKANERFLEIAKRLGRTEEPRATAHHSRVSGAQEAAQALEGEWFTPPSEDRILQKLAEITAGEVAIRVKEGDTEAILFGEWLGLVFIKAGWTVPTFEACPLPPEEQNLTLSISANYPFPKKASTIHSALAAAGVGLVFGVDPTSDSPIPTLIVPRRPVGASDRTWAAAPRFDELAGNSPEKARERDHRIRAGFLAVRSRRMAGWSFPAHLGQFVGNVLF